MEYKINLATADVPDSGTLTVYYKISGGADGGIEGTIEADLAEGTYTVPSEYFTIPSSGTKVKVKVTDIEYSEY